LMDVCEADVIIYDTKQLDRTVVLVSSALVHSKSTHYR
jgi:hypothetical protein